MWQHYNRRALVIMRIRIANEDDFERLAEIYNSARVTAGCFSGDPVDTEGLKALTEGEVVYVAERHDQIVGFASVWSLDNFLHHLYVTPDLHGQGIGSELLIFCSDTHGPLSLKCEIRNFSAREFYRKRGWIASERGDGVDGAWERLFAPAGAIHAATNHPQSGKSAAE